MCMVTECWWQRYVRKGMCMARICLLRWVSKGGKRAIIAVLEEEPFFKDPKSVL